MTYSLRKLFRLMVVGFQGVVAEVLPAAPVS